MRGLDILFELEVVQGYFAQSEARRLRFSPNVQSADWICRTGVIVRTTPRGIRVYRESGRALGQGGNGPPAQLEFWVKSDDPLFGAYTAGLDIADEAVAASDPDRIAAMFDLALATADLDGKFVLSSCLPACPLDSGPVRPARQGFRVSVPIALPGASSPLYQIALASREVVWKYLLDSSSWGPEAPRLSEVEPQSADTPTEPVAFSPGDREVLADGRTALAFYSSEPLPLLDRSPRRFALWAGAGLNNGKIVVPVLPNASAANLARAGPQSRDLVAEIIVPR